MLCPCANYFPSWALTSPILVKLRMLKIVSHNTLATWWEDLTHLKRPWCWERLRTGGEGDNRDEIAGWHHRLNGLKFESTLGADDGQGGLVWCIPWGCKESDTTERLNWTESLGNTSYIPSGYQVLNCSATLLLTRDFCYLYATQFETQLPYLNLKLAEFQMKKIILSILQL